MTPRDELRQLYLQLAEKKLEIAETEYHARLSEWLKVENADPYSRASAAALRAFIEARDQAVACKDDALYNRGVVSGLFTKA